MQINLSYAEIGVLLKALKLSRPAKHSPEIELGYKLCEAVYDDMSHTDPQNRIGLYQMWLEEHRLTDFK